MGCTCEYGWSLADVTDPILFFMHNSNISPFISHNLLRVERQVFILEPSWSLSSSSRLEAIWGVVIVRSSAWLGSSSAQLSAESQQSDWYTAGLSDAQTWTGLFSILRFSWGVDGIRGFFSIWGEVIQPLKQNHSSRESFLLYHPKLRFSSVHDSA